MADFAARLARWLRVPLVIYLSGDLGAGKTTLARALLRHLGYPGNVKSPSYGLLETYDTDELQVLHLDLFRIAEPGELEFLGLRDLLNDQTLLLIEWPENGGRFLPQADLSIGFEHAGTRRNLSWKAHTRKGASICQSLTGDIE